MDIIIGEGRRRWSEEEKRAIVSEVMTSGRPLSQIARRHNINPSMLFSWRKRYRDAVGQDLSTSARPITFGPAMILGDPAAEPSDRKAYPSHDHCVVELDFESGARLRVYASADANLVKAVIEAMTHQ